MSIELKIDYEALARELAPILKAHMEQMKPKPDRLRRADIKEMIGCSDTYLRNLLANPKFPKCAGSGHYKTWDRSEVERFVFKVAK
jgi:hypothetical protein